MRLPAAFEQASGSLVHWPAQEWYRDFGSDELNALVDAAVRAGSDLEIARARVAQADARARQAGAAILPSVSVNGFGNYLAGHSSQGAGHELDWAMMLSTSYEVDFWGKNRAAAASARLAATASRAERDAIALTTLAGVANAYFQVLALRERLAVAESNRDVARELLAVVQARFDVSMASPIELSTQKAALDTAEIAITELQQAEVEARASLSLLLGQPPERFEVKGQPLESLREPAVAAGLPSELLARRPDVFLAESNLAAGHADLLAARAAMFPSLALTISGGVQNPALPATVLTIPGVGPSLSLGATLIQPIFDHGKLAARRDEVRAKEVELLAAYRVSIIAALGDVENALAALQHLDQARQYQIDNREQTERAFEGARLRYRAGSADFLTLLEAQRSLYAARDQLIQYRLARLRALVGLCKALGGGWSQPQGLIPPPATQQNSGA
jgi:NodT family efflux transporter outer membrane factor (OMF) lipoprotein